MADVTPHRFCPAASQTSHPLEREHEASFLLPQFMGALAGEFSAFGVSEHYQTCADKSLLAKFCALLKRLR